MGDEKIHVYFMPGMAANPSIFKNIDLPKAKFEQHLLQWSVPKKGITLSEYALEMTTHVKHDNPVLLGVSFGGMLVQEMARHIKTRKVIVVSSVKHESELPKRMLFARYTKIHKLLPTGLVNNVELLAKYAFGETVTKRLELYEEYLSIRDKYYIDWSLDNIVNWKCRYCPDCLVHIHGEKDAVFPIGNIKDCIPVKNGTHTMIIHRAKWFNEHLPTIILQ
ncbi:alpha/beta hydrolase [Aggregatimonas sangjinii]|uniref:Alpha/beta hydrolase n=1 Tax=Aggregatimonas sangjinii TaxID=2583587 RepID=A0A5B7SSR8_9FLAO|nr:alpha/beta hydrolase [Aggregatimonas sangjinii]QCX00359.1 alpha/beta hydrolase [Aggregatimonas sangjinii]